MTPWELMLWGLAAGIALLPSALVITGCVAYLIEQRGKARHLEEAEE